MCTEEIVTALISNPSDAAVALLIASCVELSNVADGSPASPIVDVKLITGSICM
jgi:hypothetical protein